MTDRAVERTLRQRAEKAEAELERLREAAREAVSRDDAIKTVKEMLRAGTTAAQIVDVLGVGQPDPEGSDWRTPAEKWMVRARNAEAELERLREAARAGDELLRRLAEWDVMVVSCREGGDGRFWRNEIDRVRAALSSEEDDE